MKTDRQEMNHHAASFIVERIKRNNELKRMQALAIANAMQKQRRREVAIVMSVAAIVAVSAVAFVLWG